MPPSRPLTTLGGRYALREPLGEGSFAVTYLAEDLVLGRLVAVKVLHARYGNDPAAAARFEREARAAAAVSSPYLVDVFDYGNDQGASYIVLQYVAGPTLRTVIDRAGRLGPRDAVRIAVDVLRGLAVIHEAGIIHRDVKPQNVLIDRTGAARVTDFGVALWAGMEHLTSQGLAVGTAVYMAPEQAHGTNVTPSADLYAVGVLLFEMLTGRPPFQADHPAALMLAHVRQTPPLPSEVLPSLSLPVAVEREVMRALAKNPAERRASAKEMANALEAASAGLGTGQPTTPGQSYQPETTDSVPALVGRAPAPHPQATSIAPAVRRAPMLPGGAWLGPLSLLAVALVILGIIAVSGGFRGLAGLVVPPAPDGDAGLVIATATSEVALQPAPVATVGTDPSVTINPVPMVTVPPAPNTALFPIGPTVSPEQAPAATMPGAPPVMTPTPAPPPTEPVESIAVAPTSEPTSPANAVDAAANAGDGGGAPDGMALNFGPGDWQGAAPSRRGVRPTGRGSVRC